MEDSSNEIRSVIRKNPFTDEWIIYSSSRQIRPDRAKDYCPFCEGGEEYSDFSKPKVILNKYPALNSSIDFKYYRLGKFMEQKTGFGYCKMVVYTDIHDTKFVELGVDKALEIFETWIQATNQLKSDENIKYILPFENYGSDVGATLIHPHGQIYGFPFIPNNISKEFEKIVKYKQREKSCMVCDYIYEELKKPERIVYEDEYAVIIVPFFAQYAYDIYIYPKRHVSFLSQTTRLERTTLADFLLKSIKALNILFGKNVSYSLSLHQAPVNTKQSLTYHLYFKIHTPQRNEKSLKLLGAVETSTGMFINGTLPEEAAAQLRKIMINMF